MVFLPQRESFQIATRHYNYFCKVTTNISIKKIKCQKLFAKVKIIILFSKFVNYFFNLFVFYKTFL